MSLDKLKKEVSAMKSMKRLISLAMVALLAFCAVPSLADGTVYQTQEVHAQEYYVLANNTPIYQDKDCQHPIGTLNFGDKVLVQSDYELVSYVMYASGDRTNGILVYIEKCKIGQPLKKVRLTGYVDLSPTKDATYDVQGTYASAVGGYRTKEDAFVLVELEGHYLLITDEGYSGWVRSDDSNLKVTEVYRTENALRTDYYVWTCQDAASRNNSYYKGSYYILRPSLTLYSSASNKSSSNGKVGFGTEVTILENNGEWARVRTQESKTGYVRNAYVGAPKMKIWIGGKVNLSPLPGLQDWDYASAACGTASNTDAFVLGSFGTYYFVVTADGHTGFVYMGNPNVQITELFDYECYDEYDYDYYGNG